MRIKNIVIPVAAATMLVFGSYGCGSEPEAEQTVEQTDDMESETDAEDTADTDESDTAGDTAEQSTEEDTSADEKTTAVAGADTGADESDSTGDTAGTSESADNDAESTTTGDESAADESGADESGVTVNSAHDDVQLGDDEYKGNNELDGAYESLSDEEKAEVDQIVEEVKKEHPELFEDNSGNIPYTGPAQGPVDTGELTDPDSYGHGDYSEGAGAIVY